MITANQTQRIWEICRQWNAVRDGSREEATPAEVVEYLITQEEIGIQAMLAEDAAETQVTITHQLQREDLAS